MSQLADTLIGLAVYLAFLAAGFVLSTRPALRQRPLPWLGRFQTLALMIIILALSVQLGANREVTASLGTIGLSALAITLAAMGGSLLFVFLLRRFILRLDRRGRTAAEAAPDVREDQAHPRGKVDMSMTRRIVITMAAGMLAGYFLVPPALTAYCGSVVDFGLYLLLFLVGMDMGRQDTLLQDVRGAGLRVLAVPLATAAGSLAFAALAGLFLPLGPKDAMAVASGLGWYSLAPSLLASYSLPVSAIAFLSNIMREVLSIVTVPLCARWVGHVETVSLAGATAMDTLLPVVVGATSERMVLYSLVSGLLLSLAVPLLVPAVVALPF